MFTMSRQLLIGQLRIGKTGNEILEILDAILRGVDGDSSDSAVTESNEYSLNF